MVYRLEREPTNWFAYIGIALGTMGVSFAFAFGYMNYRDDDWMIKYGECTTSQTKLALKMANQQTVFLNAEVKSTSALLQCRQSLIVCQSSKPKVVKKPTKKKYKKKKYNKKKI